MANLLIHLTIITLPGGVPTAVPRAGAAIDQWRCGFAAGVG